MSEKRTEAQGGRGVTCPRWSGMVAHVRGEQREPVERKWALFLRCNWGWAE